MVAIRQLAENLRVRSLSHQRKFLTPVDGVRDPCQVTKHSKPVSRDDVRSIVIAALVYIQETSGRTVPKIGDNTCPFYDLEGFDSVNAEEATMYLVEKLGLDLHMADPFLTLGDAHPPSVGTVVERLMKLAPGRVSQ